MNRLLLFFSLILAAINPEQAGAQTPSCLGREPAPIALSDADLIFAVRALEIIRTALDGDEAGLVTLVSPDAEFQIWRGDYTTSARSRGVEGAVEMVRDLDPVSYQISVGSHGPIAIDLTQCAYDVTLLFRTNELDTGAEPNTGVVLEFAFTDGLLVTATGYEVALFDGIVR
jgi:hypothetical protein